VTGARAGFGVALPILLFFLVGGIVFWIAIPDIYIGQIWVGVSLLLGLIFGGLYVKQRGERRVMAEGIQGTAQILGITQTGMYVNNQPQVELHMRVEGPGIAPYEVHKRFIVPLIAMGSLSGGRLNVAIDREDHQNVVINWSQAAAPMTISTQDGRSFDLNADPALRQQVFAVLAKYGLGTSGALDLRQHPQARAEVLALLESSGHQVDAAQAAPPAAPAAPAAEAKPDPAARLEQLRQLKEKGLVSEAEYESKRIQIISEF
jgi:hypothetical protein